MLKGGGFMEKLTKRDKIFYSLYGLVVVLFIIYDITILDLSYKLDLMFYFIFIAILNIYQLFFKKNNTR